MMKKLFGKAKVVNCASFGSPLTPGIWKMGCIFSPDRTIWNFRSQTTTELMFCFVNDVNVILFLNRYQWIETSPRDENLVKSL